MAPFPPPLCCLSSRFFLSVLANIRHTVPCLLPLALSVLPQPSESAQKSSSESLQLELIITTCLPTVIVLPPYYRTYYILSVMAVSISTSLHLIIGLLIPIALVEELEYRSSQGQLNIRLVNE